MSAFWIEVTEVESDSGHGDYHRWRFTVERSWHSRDAMPPSPNDVPDDIRQTLLKWLTAGAPVKASVGVQDHVTGV